MSTKPEVGCSCGHRKLDHGLDPTTPEISPCAVTDCKCVRYEGMRAPAFVQRPHDEVRERLWALGCHLDVYDRDVAAGTDPKVAGAAVEADWRTKRQAEEERDAKDPRNTRSLSGRAVTITQADVAVARVRTRKR